MIQVTLHIARDNPVAAEKLADKIAAKIELLRDRPSLYRVGRVPNTREMVVHPNYVLIFRVYKNSIHILRIRHAARRWPEGG